MESINNLYDTIIYPNDLLSIIKLLFYLPIGCVLFLIRFIVLVILSFTINNTKSSSINYLCKILGLFSNTNRETRVRREEEEEGGRTIFISNHVTCFDFLILKSLINNLNIAENNYYYQKSKHNQFLNRILFLDSLSTDNKKTDSSHQPLCSFPELESTNGKHGLLEFNSDVFELILNGKQVDTLVPVCLNVNYHLLPFSVNYKYSNTATQLVCTLFAPAVSFKVEFLEPIKLNHDETQNPNELSKQLQTRIASKLGLKCTNLSLNDLNKMKNDEEEKQVKQNVNDFDSNKIVRQISDILPDLPVGIITQHVNQANALDIDSLIMELLEKSSKNQEKHVANEKKVSDAPNKPQKKLLTYVEQKKVLLEEARRRYLAKNKN